MPSYFYYYDPETRQVVENREFIEYAYKNAYKSKRASSIDEDALSAMYRQYSQQKENERRKAGGQSTIDFPDWYDPTGRVDIYTQKKAYAAKYLPDINNVTEEQYRRISEYFEQDLEKLQEFIAYVDAVDTAKAKAKALGWKYEEGMALPTWDEASPIAQFYQYGESEEDKIRKQYGLPPVSYTSEFPGEEGRAALVRGELAPSLELSNELVSAYGQLVSEARQLAREGKLDRESFDQLYKKYPQFEARRGQVLAMREYEAKLAATPPGDKYLQEKTGSVPKPPKSHYNEAFLQSVGWDDEFYDKLYAELENEQRQWRTARRKEGVHYIGGEYYKTTQEFPESRYEEGDWRRVPEMLWRMFTKNYEYTVAPASEEDYEGWAAAREESDKAALPDSSFEYAGIGFMAGLGEMLKGILMSPAVLANTTAGRKDLLMAMSEMSVLPGEADKRIVRYGDKDKLGAYEFGSTLGSAVGSVLAFTTGPVGGRVIVGLSSFANNAANSFADAYMNAPEGLSEQERTTYAQTRALVIGAITGATEATLEGALGAGGRVARKLVAGTAKSAARGVVSRFGVKVLSDYLKGIGGEILEENIQNFISNALRKAMIDRSQKVFDFEEVKKTTLYSGIVAAILGAAGVAGDISGARDARQDAIFAAVAAQGDAFSGLPSREMGLKILDAEFQQRNSAKIEDCEAMLAQFREDVSTVAQQTAEETPTTEPVEGADEFQLAETPMLADQIIEETGVAPESPEAQRIVEAVRQADETGDTAPIVQAIQEVVGAEDLPIDAEPAAAAELEPEIREGIDVSRETSIERLESLREDTAAEVAVSGREADKTYLAEIDRRLAELAAAPAQEAPESPTIAQDARPSQDTTADEDASTEPPDEPVAASSVAASLEKLRGVLANDPRNAKQKIEVTTVQTENLTARQRALTDFGRSLGIAVVFYKNSGKVQHNEFFDPDNSGVVFVNVKGPAKSVEWAFGHGLFHALDQRGLMAQVVEAVGKDPTNYDAEAFADEMGNAIAAPTFWTLLKAKSNELFEKVAQTVRRLLGRVAKSVTGIVQKETGLFTEQEAEQYTKNVASLISAIAETTTEEEQAIAGAALLFSDWQNTADEVNALIQAIREDEEIYNKLGKEFWPQRLQENPALMQEMVHRYRTLLARLLNDGLPKRYLRTITGLMASKNLMQQKIDEVNRTYQEKLAKLRTKSQERIDQLKAEQREAIEEIRKKHKERRDEMTKKHIKELKALTALMRSRLDNLKTTYEKMRREDADLLRERFKRNLARAELRKRKTELRHRVQKLSAAADTMQRISDESRQILREFSKALLPTLNNRSFSGKITFGGVYGMLTGDNVVWFDKDGNEIRVGIDAEKPLQLMRALEGRDISTFDSDDMRDLEAIVKWIARFPQGEHKLLVGLRKLELRKVQAEAAEAVKAEHKKKLTKGQQILDKVFTDWDSLTITRVARRILGTDSGDAYRVIARSFYEATKRKGELYVQVYDILDELAEHLKKTPTLFSNEDEKFITVTVEVMENNEKVKKNIDLTRGEAVWVALNARNVRNRHTLTVGGKLWTEKALPGFEDGTIDNIVHAVDNNAEIAWWRDKILGLYELTRDWYNEASLKAHFFEFAREMFYYPIERDRTRFTASSGFVSMTFDSLPNMFPRVKRSNVPYDASNPLELVRGYLFKAAEYNSYLLAVRNLKYLILTPSPLREAIRERLGEAPLTYLSNYIYNIESGQTFGMSPENKLNRIVRAIRTRTTAAAITSPPAWAKQVTAYALAARSVNSKNLAAALFTFDKRDADMMRKYAPALWLRRHTGPNIETVETSKLLPGKIMSAVRPAKAIFEAMKHVGVRSTQAVDTYVIARIWNACKLQIKADMPGINPNSEAFWKRVAEMATEIVFETQSNFDVALRSNVGNDKREMMRILTVFSTDRNMLRNVLEDARWDFTHARKGKAARTFAGVMVSCAGVAAINSLAALYALRGLDDKDDEWGEFMIDFALTVTGVGYVSGLIGEMARGFMAGHIAIESFNDMFAATRNLIMRSFDEDNKGGLGPYVRTFADRALRMTGINLLWPEKYIFLPILARMDWEYYDAYARLTAMGLDASDYYPVVLQSVHDNNIDDLKQVANVIARYVVGKQKEKPTAQTFPYRTTDWYQEAKKEAVEKRKPFKYEQWDAIYREAYLAAGGTKP